MQLSTANIESKAANTPPVIKDLNGTECGQFARAWVNFNGSTDTINDSFNIASITDVSAGIKTVTFTTAMSSANYCVVTDCHSTQANRNQVSMLGGSSENDPSTTSFDIVTMGSTNNSVYDAVITYAVVFGG